MHQRGPRIGRDPGPAATVDVPAKKTVHFKPSKEIGWGLVNRLSSTKYRLYVDHVLQADQGVDLDFLVGKRGSFVPRDNH